MSGTKRFARFGLLAASVALAPIAANAEEFINILTGGTGGVYYPLGVAMSKIYAEKIANSKPSVQSDLTWLFWTKRCETIAWKGAGHAEEEVQRGTDRDGAASD